MKKKKAFVTPTNFEVTLMHKDMNVLVPVMKWLLKRGCHDFQWESRLIGTPESKYSLSIQTSWADNLAKVAKLLKDYKLLK